MILLSVWWNGHTPYFVAHKKAAANNCASAPTEPQCAIGDDYYQCDPECQTSGFLEMVCSWYLTVPTALLERRRAATSRCRSNNADEETRAAIITGGKVELV
jgi:hypothetical protein